jgi:nucleoside-diphosphate-sugar epimerase
MKSYLKPNVFAIDIASRVAAIPGTGDVPVTFTYTFDLARFVVAALDLEQWSEESRVVGDEVTWNEFVGLAEEVTGICCTPVSPKLIS